MGPRRSAYHGTSRDRWRVVRWPSGLQDLYASFLDWHSWTTATFISECSRSRLEFSCHQQYLSITSRSDDVLPPQSLWLLMSSGIRKRALPSRVERPFAFRFPVEVFHVVRASAYVDRSSNGKMEQKEEGKNRSQIGLPADACAQPPPAPSRLLVLRRAVSPARPSQQGCSAAVASVRLIGGPGGVFEKNEDRKGWHGAGPEPSRQGQIPCRSSRLTRAL